MSSNQPTESGRVSIRPASAKDAPWETVVLFEARDELLGLPELERQIRLTEAGVSFDVHMGAKISVETLGRTLLLAVGSETDHTTLLAELRTSYPPLQGEKGKASGAFFRIDWNGQRVLVEKDSLNLGPIPYELIAAVAQEMKSAVADYLEQGLPEIRACGARFPALAPRSWAA